MTDKILYIGLLGIGIPLVYLVVSIVFDFLLRGFAPFMPARPWVVEQLMAELKLPVDRPIKLLAYSTGRSGVFHALEKRYPNAELVAVEPSLFPFVISWIQAKVRGLRMKVINTPLHRADISDVDFIYSHLDPDKLRAVDSKIRFECKPGTIVISTGYNIPTLTPTKVVPLPDRKGRFDFLSKNQKLFQSKYSKFKKEKKAYFYTI